MAWIIIFQSPVILGAAGGDFACLEHVRHHLAFMARGVIDVNAWAQREESHFCCWNHLFDSIQFVAGESTVTLLKSVFNWGCVRYSVRE